MTELDKAAQMAMHANVKQSTKSKLAEFWDDQPKVMRLILSIAGGGVFLAGLWWEGNAAGLGYQKFGQGTAPGPVAYVFGFCMVIGAIVAHRVMREAQRDKEPHLNTAIAALVMGVILSLFGVVSNMVAQTEANTVEARTLTGDRGEAESQTRLLRARVVSFDEATMRAILEADQRALTAARAEATGWGMADLDPAGACNADLRPRQRQLCNEVNGADGLLASVALTQAALDSHETAKAALALAEGRLSGISAEETANFWNSLAAVMPNNGDPAETAADARRFSVIGTIVISILVLIFLMVSSDAVLEYRERRAAQSKGT
jgi:hypothetical protein